MNVHSTYSRNAALQFVSEELTEHKTLARKPELHTIILKELSIAEAMQSTQPKDLHATPKCFVNVLLF